jgi:transposase
MTITKDSVHIITSVERRTRWSSEEKKTIIRETYSPGNSVSQVARKYGINPSQLFNWRRWMEEGAHQGVNAEEELVPKSVVRDLERQIRDLERMLGKKTLENEILKEAVKLGQEKKLISRQPWPGNTNSLSGQ